MPAMPAMFVRRKARRLTSKMSPERTYGERDHQRLRVQLPDGTVQVWRTGTRLRQGQRYGRGAPMEVRNIGKHEVRVEGDVPRSSYHAQLVTTERVAGKRRQRIIAYLGSYQDGEQDDLDARIGFWRAVKSGRQRWTCVTT